MNCREAKERLAEGRETAAVRRHLAGCPDCAAYGRELETGGREIADAFLAVGPSPGFEERVGARLVETEVSAGPRARRRFAALAAAAVLPLALAVTWFALLRTGDDAPPAAPPAPPAPEVAERQVVVTEPEQDNPLVVHLRREAARTTVLDLRFAGDARRVPGMDAAFDALLHAFARGARRAEVTVDPDVPSRDVATLVESLERAGFAWDLLRRRRP